jgi:ubiquinone/menaquinone biosynthesis C-methylase UbiE
MHTSLVLRYYAFAYDVLSSPAEQAGLAARRHELLSLAEGATLELGAATGLNLRHYPAAVSGLVLTEPNPHMLRQMRRRVAKVRPDTGVVRAGAERLPFADDSFDTVVVIFTLCNVPDQDAAIRETARVLVPGGRLLFLEHVRSADPRVAAKQDRMPLPYRLLGCHPNRNTRDRLEMSELKLESIERGDVPRAPEIERPMIVGVARKPD